MVDNRERLLKEYGDRVKANKKTTAEIVEFLHQKGCVEKISESEVPKFILKNAIYSLTNSFDIREEDFIKYLKCPKNFIKDYNFIIYKFVMNDYNNMFYTEYKSMYKTCENGIYVIIEVNTNTVYCNCSKLQLELFIYKGIDEEDIKNKTDNFYLYLFYLESMDLHMY